MKGVTTQEEGDQTHGIDLIGCGSKRHWSQVCRTLRHLCQLYHESIKGKVKEVNLNEHFVGTTSTYLESSDFMGDFDEATHQNN
uniref:Uncharacterized protein n=1 Tax=Brassica oleracea var. oleracea TaxID=109376 RepID=A0A0D3AMP8_BRAOL